MPFLTIFKVSFYLYKFIPAILGAGFFGVARI
jgi:hypothetical protein